MWIRDWAGERGVDQSNDADSQRYWQRAETTCGHITDGKPFRTICMSVRLPPAFYTDVYQDRSDVPTGCCSKTLSFPSSTPRPEIGPSFTTKERR